MDKSVKSMDGNTIKHTLPQADEVLENIKDKGTEYWGNAKEKGRHLWNEAQASGQKKWSTTRGFIKKHPVKSVGVAAVIGVVLGMLLSLKGQD